MTTESLNKINFMSDEKFSEVETTSDSELYLVNIGDHIKEIGDGFIKLSSGRLICYGKVKSDNSNTNALFARPFADTNYWFNCFAMINGTNNTGGTFHSMVFEGYKTTTGVNNLFVGQASSAASRASGYTHNWIAIGQGA